MYLHCLQSFELTGSIIFGGYIYPCSGIAYNAKVLLRKTFVVTQTVSNSPKNFRGWSSTRPLSAN